MELEEFGANDLKGMSTGQIIEFLSQLLLKVKSIKSSCIIIKFPIITCSSAALSLKCCCQHLTSVYYCFA